MFVHRAVIHYQPEDSIEQIFMKGSSGFKAV